MRQQAWLAVAAALALAACDGESGTDAGADSGPAPTDGGGGGMDAGTDAGAAEEDAGTDAGTMADGGTMDPDGGTLMVGDCTGAPVTVMAACPTFTACGGAIAEGDYCYTGVCIDEATILGPAQERCATARLENPGGMIAGQVSFLPGDQVAREAVTHVEATLVFPCGLIVFGCSAVPGQIEEAIPGSSATCEVVGGECRCDITIDSTVDTTDSYVPDETAGTLIVGSGSTERTYDYCVDTTDSSLRFVETTADGTLEPGIQSLAPAPAP